jgi:flagellar hook-basal body complex protein FliE
MTLPPLLPVAPAAIPALDASPIAAISPQGTAAAPGFGAMITQGLDQVNQQLNVAETDLQKMAVGQGGSLHGAMIRFEQARLSFQLMMQVRSRLLEAYDDVMKMQI